MGRIVIVGAGPAGAALALALRRHGGVAVDLVEADPDGLDRFRGEGLMPGGLEALERLGVWPLPEAVPHRLLSGWSFHLERRLLFTAGEPFADGSVCGLIDQPALLRHLLQRLEAAGGQLHRGQPVVGLQHRDDRVCGVTLADGRRLEADLVVACDGRDSSLRRMAGLRLQEDTPPLTVLWFQLTGPGTEALAEALAGRFVTCIGGGDSWALFASVRGGLQLGWAESATGVAADRPHPDTARAWLERWASVAHPALAGPLAALADGAVAGPSLQPVRVGLAARWSRPGLLLLGDAAHPMSPLRAQGLSMALRDAVVAAAGLAPVLAAGSAEAVDAAAIDAAAAAVATRRRREITLIQHDQQREAERADRLRRQGWLRSLLKSLAPVAGPANRRRWVREQDRLRHGLPLA